MPPGGSSPAPLPSGNSAPVPAPARQSLGRKQRLRRTAQFRDAYDQNRRWHGRCMVLFLRAAPWPAVVADLLKLARQAGLASSPGES